MFANTQKQKFTSHAYAVAYLSQALLRIVTANNADNALLIATFTAGALHDLGKLDTTFQQWLTKTKTTDNDDGQHIDNKTFSFENYPRHNELSLLLFSLLKDPADKTINRANFDVIEHVIYWHHAKPARKNDYKTLDCIYRPVLKTLGDASFAQLISTCQQTVTDINKLAADYGTDFRVMAFTAVNENVLHELDKRLLPAYKNYRAQNSLDDYRVDSRKNAYCAVARAAVITADRLISDLSAAELERLLIERGLDTLAQQHLQHEDALAAALQNCLAGFEQSYPNSPRNQQQQLAAEQLATVRNIAVLQGAAGCGKTKIALEWALQTGAKKIIWVCPRVQICQGLYNDLTAADYLPNVRVEIYTGEFKTLHIAGIEQATTNETAFSGDVVITTIDQVTQAILTHRHVTTLIDLLNSHVVFDEYHEYITLSAFNLLFAELLECKKHCGTAANTLLVSATPNAFFLEDFLGIHPLDCIRVETFNRSRYHIHFVAFDEQTTDDTNPFYAPQPRNSFVISNTAITAQRSYLQNEPREKALLLHSKFKQSDKQQIFAQVMRAFSYNGDKSVDVLRSGPIVQAALNISCDNMVSEITHAENSLQRLGRLDRFGQNSDINHYHIAVPNTFAEKKITSSCARFLNDQHSLSSTKAWLAYLQKNTDDTPLTLSDIYTLYDNFYRDDKRRIAVSEDFNKALCASVELIKAKVFDPVMIPRNKTSKDTGIKIKKHSLRGDTRFVQMAVCEVAQGKVLRFAESYAYAENDDADNLTLSVEEIRGYGKSDKNLLAFMAKKHHNIKADSKKSYNDNALLHKARSSEFPIYVSYTVSDLQAVACANPDYTLYYVQGQRQAVGVMANHYLNFQQA